MDEGVRFFKKLSNNLIHKQRRSPQLQMAYPSHRVKDGDIISVDPSSVSVLSGERGTELTFTPKPFSQPFLFVPDYLEVNYNICSTVFLRAPMSKPGRTEIPSPFPPEMHSLVYEFYAKRK